MNIMKCVQVNGIKINKKIEFRANHNGYEYEFVESVRCINNGMIESGSMPLCDTIYVMEAMDKLRAKWGLVYPGEA